MKQTTAQATRVEIFGGIEGQQEADFRVEDAEVKVETEKGRWLAITGSVGDTLVGDLLSLQGRLLEEDGENGGGFWNTQSVGMGCMYTFVPERDWPAVSEVLTKHGVRFEE